MPAAKSISQHRRDGTYRADRHGRRATAEKRSVQLKIPDTLDPSMRRMWKRVVGTLDADWMAAADTWLLAGLVEAVYWQAQAAQALARDGTVIKTVNGDVHRNPHFMIWRQAMEAVRTLSAKLGLSPLDRARLLAATDVDGEPDVGQEFADLMAALRGETDQLVADDW